MVKKFSNQEFEISVYMGAQVSKEHKFFQVVACMTQKWRMIVGYLEILKLINPENTVLIKKIDSVYIPMCQIIGQAEWLPDIITNLAMKVGDNTETYDAE
ncbi:MAG: hypothetical protein MUO31_04800 [Thermodesulfovibrionales bacterium]|nr:hypothetical protein [Thermodesulfovibrionales bacterium]